MSSKICTRCEKKKSVDEFYKNQGMADGRLSQCIGCVRDYQNKRNKANPGPSRIQAREWRSKNRKHHRAQVKKWRQENRDKVNEYSRRRYHDPKNRQKVEARYAAINAVRYGKLIRPTNCSRCGTRCTPEAHHPDYSKPLDVEWLCRTCHKKEDQGMT